MLGDRVPLRGRDRFALALFAMTLAAAATELVQTRPQELPGFAFTLLWLSRIVAFSAAWTFPVALAIGACAAAKGWLERQAEPPGGQGRGGPADGSGGDPRAAPTWIVWVAPVGLLQVSAGTALLGWSHEAFVRQDLAAAVMSVALLIAFAAIAFLGFLAHRAAHSALARLPPRGLAALAGAGALLAAAIHLGRYPAILRDPMAPVLVQVALVGALGALVFTLLRSFRFRPGSGLLLGGGACAWLVVFAAAVQGGKMAPFSDAVASRTLQEKGLAAARIAPLTRHVFDRSGAGGLDCEVSDPDRHPLAQDCRDPELSRQQVEAARRERRERNRTSRRQVDSAILITVDTLRSDAVGFGGAPQPSSPNLDALAERSTVFEGAWSPAPMTRRAFPAILASRYPSNVHWLDREDDYPYTVSHPDNLYLAEVAEDAGLQTGMAVPFSYANNSRFDQGFAEQEVRPASQYPDHRTAHLVVDDAIEMLEGWAEGEAPERFFLWVHFYEPHYPYVEHEEFGFGDDDFDRYLSEMRYVDEHLGRLFERLKELDLAESTALAFTSDHGEEFGEHGGEHHGDLYPEDLRVPLLVHVPGAGGRRIEAPGRIIDVAPTLAELLGLTIPEAFDGDSFVPQIEGEPMEARPIYAELIPDSKVPRHEVSLISGGHQLIVDFALGSRELYDLRADPFAKNDRLLSEPDTARELDAELRRFMSLWIGPYRESRASELEDADAP